MVDLVQSSGEGTLKTINFVFHCCLYPLSVRPRKMNMNTHMTSSGDKCLDNYGVFCVHAQQIFTSLSLLSAFNKFLTAIMALNCVHRNAVWAVDDPVEIPNRPLMKSNGIRNWINFHTKVNNIRSVESNMDCIFFPREDVLCSEFMMAAMKTRCLNTKKVDIQQSNETAINVNHKMMKKFLCIRRI